ncbi:DUF308 domain-containing protein [Limosilactobacillus fermentum]
MILLVVFGGLIFVLGCFYLVNSWQQYHQWKFATLLVLVSLAVTVYGVINLPYWHKNSSAQTSTQTSAKSSSSGTSSNSISGYSNNPALSSSTANMTQEQKEAAVLKQLQSSYSKFGSVAFDSGSKTFQIDPSSGDEADSLKYLAQNPTQASSMGWSSLTDWRSSCFFRPGAKPSAPRLGWVLGRVFRASRPRRRWTGRFENCELR